MSEYTTVRVDTGVLEALGKLKKHPRESYNEVIAELVELAKHPSKENERFFSEIQKAKMKELWDNKEDEAWEHA
jgi:predicted CopG family antitoxin